MTISGRVFGTLPASDLQRARKFYEQTIGIKPGQDTPEGVVFECADNSRILLFPSTGHASGTHTQASFEVRDVEAEVEALKSRGVMFEEYDMPGFTSVNGVVTGKDGSKSAWLKDTEGNLIALTERMPV